MTPHTNTIIEAEQIATDETITLPAPEKERSFLDLTVLLVQHKRFVARFVLASVVFGLIVAFVWPVRYEAKVTLLPPAQTSSLSSALLGQFGNLGALNSLTALAGGFSLKNPADVYVSLLTSRTVEDAMINRFNLMAEYHEKRMIDTRKVFERRTSVSAGNKDGLIRITLEDHDPKRAAEMANAYVDEFHKLTSSLAITEAARRRLFFQEELKQAKDELTAAEEAMRKTQQSTGVLQIDSQARALIETAAMLRAQVMAKEVEIESMRSFAAEDNPALIMAKQQLTALQAQLQQIAGSQHDTGSDIVLSKGRVTEAGMEYIRRYRDLKYSETVFELLAKELEVAKLDEAREGEIVQVVDPAVVPDKKSSPHRTLIVLASTILGFFVAVYWITMRENWSRALELPENRRRVDAIKGYWKRKQKRL